MYGGGEGVQDVRETGNWGVIPKTVNDSDFPKARSTSHPIHTPGSTHGFNSRGLFFYQMVKVNQKRDKTEIKIACVNA